MDWNAVGVLVRSWMSAIGAKRQLTLHISFSLKDDESVAFTSSLVVLDHLYPFNRTVNLKLVLQVCLGGLLGLIISFEPESEQHSPIAR